MAVGGDGDAERRIGEEQARLAVRRGRPRTGEQDDVVRSLAAGLASADRKRRHRRQRSAAAQVTRVSARTGP